MAFAWKTAGISYLQYAQICARAVRNALKEEQRVIAQRRDEQGLKFAKWEAGKQGEVKNVEFLRSE
ncbi:3270_t:CDS:2 [Ambispora leptoticha]|uniref:3270_t:CDS:1 n=1 Tax=Ambispora leptoticha TaxID=144679 RepID=A0A9N8VBN0_9GLOM|nr:3270_t:CDS:2 [Ambispora leptoticha]